MRLRPYLRPGPLGVGAVRIEFECRAVDWSVIQLPRPAAVNDGPGLATTHRHEGRSRCYAATLLHGFHQRPEHARTSRSYAGLGTDAPTAFRVPESRDGPTADRSDASIGFQSGNVCVSASEQPDRRRGLQSISLHVGPLTPGGPNGGVGSRLCPVNLTT